MKRMLCVAMLSAWLMSVLSPAAACGAAQAASPAATLLGGRSTVAEVAALLRAAGLSNTDVFEEWALDFAATAGRSAGLGDGWAPLDTLHADIARCMDGWEKHHDVSDADCRMTAFLLLDGLLSADNVEPAYTGTYLMFDVEAIDTAERYAPLRKNKALFTTLFGDKSVPAGTDPRAAFSESWRAHGFRVDSKKASLLSIVLYDPDFRTAFVGHTGVLVRQDDGLLFVEKIAFEQPYQATKARDLDALLDMFSQRPEYFGEPGQPGPYVFVNGDYAGGLTH